MADYLKSDVKVGGVIFFCVLLLTGLIFYVGGFQQLERKYNIRILADSAYGVGKSSVVTYSGVKVGEVKSVRVMGLDEIDDDMKRLHRPDLAPDDIQVEMILEVNSRAVLRQDSKAEVVGSGLVGDQIVNLTPGSFKSAVLPPGTTIVGVELTGLGKLQKGIGQIDFNVLVPNVRKIVANLTDASEKLDGTMTRLNNFVADLERKNQIHNILDQTEKMVGNLNAVVTENSPKIASAINNLNQTSEDLKNDLKPILTNLKSLTANLDQMITGNKDKINELVVEMKSTAVNFNQFSEKVKKYPWTILTKTKVAPEDEKLFPKTAGIKLGDQPAPAKKENKDKAFFFF